MGIAFYKWSETDKATKAKIMRRAQANIDEVITAVTPIIKDVKARGDTALIEYATKYEKATITNLKATAAEFDAAEAALDDDLKAAIQHCARNVKKFHAEQMARVEKPWMVEIEGDVGWTAVDDDAHRWTMRFAVGGNTKGVSKTITHGASLRCF